MALISRLVEAFDQARGVAENAQKELNRADNNTRMDNGSLDYADDRASRILYTYLHEVGHQV
ncbi:hypothetical protein HRE53_22820 [Acaryochloris sp. 'Moss Beach']|uniref:hypothetical protein n=1 Tax=Acaryochloris sp. 'Moss Beach' TaxID=2740837 RepID=UPI001F22E494|nr:hypothetical protein [Acaryochloris sp. 'Moss Beach']UJB69188.1 hypothetical protein HRE53_22820 [Acaryochloris sp. 'Moss Beach']